MLENTGKIKDERGDNYLNRYLNIKPLTTLDPLDHISSSKIYRNFRTKHTTMPTQICATTKLY